jgi:hypothetical protein
LSEPWKETNKIYSRFCKKLMDKRHGVAYRSAEMELGTESRGGKFVGKILKYWYRIVCLDTEYLVKQFCDWQQSNMSVRS